MSGFFSNLSKCYLATLGALTGRDISYFPRFDDTKIEPDDVIKEICISLKDLKACDDPGKLKIFLERGRESLDEVKGLTEYEDQKAARSLTIVTFLTALVGVLFSRFAVAYPIHPLIEKLESWELLLVFLIYGIFAIFIIHVIAGALVIFHATKVTFKYPKLNSATNPKPNRAKSFLFYPGIISLKPSEWGKSFLDEGELDKLNSNLEIEYLKNYIVESYLVAAKVADKLRYLMPGQQLLSYALRLLFLWFIIYVVTIMIVPDNAYPANFS
jgi:hypothetical protein